MANINHVVDHASAPERRMDRLTRFRRCDPNTARVIEVLVMKILVEKAELPKLVGDVFANVGDRTVGAHDDLVVIVAFRIDPHDPATFILAFVFKEDGVAGFHLLEGAIPELQMKDVAFARQQIVADADAVHRFQMATDDGHGHEVGHLGRVIAVFFYLLEGLAAKRVLRVLGFVEGADTGIQVPAVIIELDRGVADQ